MACDRSTVSWKAFKFVRLAILQNTMVYGDWNPSLPSATGVCEYVERVILRLSPTFTLKKKTGLKVVLT